MERIDSAYDTNGLAPSKLDQNHSRLINTYIHL